MRSRYTAFALGDVDYLRLTWHTAFCPSELTIDARIRWLGLEILDFAERGERAQVEFEACCLLDGRVEAMRELSDFVREDGRWLYTRGQQLVPRFESWQPARNEACPCGSGGKFKRCCGAA